MVFSQLSSYGQFVQEKAIRSNEAEKYQEMQIEVFNPMGDPLIADILVKGLNPRKTVVLENVSDTAFEIKDYRLYTVSCIEEGYMYYAEKFWPKEDIVHHQKVQLQPLESGLKTSVQDITFLGDQTEIYHKSKPALEEVIRWMELNPEIRIAVIGHVNGPDKSKSEKFYNKASYKRAETVVNYLSTHGIDADRLEIRGAGNKEMLFPNPETDWQNQANRRIEIEVL
jgi:outer membrane protein OmpA-like peptidoglycan-associated protein